MLSIEKQILFLLSQTKEVTSQEFLQIYKMRGYSKQYIRNVLFTLKKNGLVYSPTRSIYSITEEGSSLIQSIRQKPLLYDKEWDSNWHVVMFEFTSNERKQRDQLRTYLLQLGFGLLYNSVYISPWDHQKQVLEFIELNKITNKVTYFCGEIMSNPLTPLDTLNIWPIEHLMAEYEKYWDWFENEFKAAIKPVNQKTEEELFINHLLLGEKLSEIMLIDPMLPKNLLPENWNGHKIFHIIYEYFLLLGDAIPKNSKYIRFVNSNLDM